MVLLGLTVATPELRYGLGRQFATLDPETMTSNIKFLSLRRALLGAVEILTSALGRICYQYFLHIYPCPFRKRNPLVFKCREWEGCWRAPFCTIPELK